MSVSYLSLGDQVILFVKKQFSFKGFFNKCLLEKYFLVFKEEILQGSGVELFFYNGFVIFYSVPYVLTSKKSS